VKRTSKEIEEAKRLKLQNEQDAEFWKDSRGDSTKRKVVDGLKIYTYEELNITNDSGGTPDCPFDCKCCYG